MPSDPIHAQSLLWACMHLLGIYGAFGSDPRDFD
jgi:hypothetical protein